MNVALTGLDTSLLLDAVLRIGLALLFTLPIAREREAHDVSAGLRTFPIVAVGACALILLSRAVLGPKSDNVTHVLQGLVTGVGFIGGGAIVKANDRVHGTATAASIWATAVIGAAVGFGQSEIALVLAVTTFITLRAVSRLEERRIATRGVQAGGLPDESR